MRKILYGLTFVGTVLVLGGCSGSTTETTVHRDGSFDRTVVLKTQSRGDDRTVRAKVHRISTIFVLPAFHGQAVTDPKHPDQDPAWVVKRHYASGQLAVHDVVIKSSKGQRVVANEAKVSPLGKDRWLFTERYHWVGRPITDNDFMDPGVRWRVKGALGPNADTETIDRLTVRGMRDFVEIGTGLNASFLTDHGGDTDKKLASAIAARLKQQASNEVERSASQAVAEAIALKSKEESSQKNPFLSAIDLPVTTEEIAVRVPGVIETTNGLQSEGQVKGVFLSVALLTGDITLSVVYHTSH